MHSPFRIAARTLLVLLFLVNLYRAATQSITHDEALTYSWFVSEPWDVIFNKYDANHHVLFTILCKLVVNLFGEASQFTMRLPTLAACALYFWTLLEIGELVFGAGWLLLLSVAALSMNPLVLDFLSAARGYGLALAFFTTGLYLLLKFLQAPARDFHNRRTLVWAGLAFAGSVCSNLTYLVPSTGAILTSLAMHWLDLRRAPAGEPRKLSLQNAARFLMTPFLVISWIVLIFPLSAASSGQFYFGAHSWTEAAESLVIFSFLSRPSYALLPNTLWLRDVSYAGMALTVVGVVALALISLQRRSRIGTPERVLVLVSGVTGSSLFAIASGFYLAGVVLPVERTAIYWILLLTFSGLLIIRFAPGPRWVSWLLQVPMLLVLAQYALEFRTTFYASWLLHRNCKDIVTYIAKDHARLGDRTVVIAGTGEMAAPINFYRQTQKLTWLAEMERRDDIQSADYWTFAVPHVDEVRKRGLKVVWKDPLSGTVLAVRSPPEALAPK